MMENGFVVECEKESVAGINLNEKNSLAQNPFGIVYKNSY